MTDFAPDMISKQHAQARIDDGGIKICTVAVTHRQIPYAVTGGDGDADNFRPHDVE